MPRNVLVLVLDTARADAFEPYGAPVGATPAVAQLARSGGAAEHVYSAASWTLPSHAAMFTGEFPRALGLGQAPGGSPAGARPVLEAATDRLLPEVLRRAGWETRAASTNVWVSPHAGFDIGFDEFELVKASGRAENVQLGWDSRKGKLLWGYEGLRARHDDGAAQAGRTVRRWIDELGEQPFFWFVNLIECHSPYLPPKPYNDLGSVDRVRAANEARRYLTLDGIWRCCLGALEVPEEPLERMRHLYRRSIRQMDDWLAGVLEALDDRGVLDDTLVVVTSDHGENLGEGGLMGHALSIDDRLIHVPFVSSDPGFLPEGGQAASLVDLPRMLASYLGLGEHPWGERALPQGFAGAQFDFVEAGDPRVQVAAEMWDLDERGQAMLTTPLTCVTDGEHKLLRRGGEQELYDLRADPLEASPIGTEPDPGHVAALDTPTLWQAGSATKESPPARDPDAEDLEARMKLLGYM